MKKALLFVAIASAAFLVACKKDRVCTCTETDSSGTVTTYTTTMYKVKKGDARENCIGSQTVTASGSISVTGNKTTCELK